MAEHIELEKVGSFKLFQFISGVQTSIYASVNYHERDPEITDEEISKVIQVIYDRNLNSTWRDPTQGFVITFSHTEQAGRWSWTRVRDTETAKQVIRSLLNEVDQKKIPDMLKFLDRGNEKRKSVDINVRALHRSIDPCNQEFPNWTYA